MGQKYFDFTKIFGEEMETLLVRLKELITSRKITDNLPDDVNKELNIIKNTIDNYNIDTIDGGEYISE